MNCKNRKLMGMRYPLFSSFKNTSIYCVPRCYYVIEWWNPVNYATTVGPQNHCKSHKNYPFTFHFSNKTGSNVTNKKRTCLRFEAVQIFQTTSDSALIFLFKHPSEHICFWRKICSPPRINVSAINFHWFLQFVAFFPAVRHIGDYKSSSYSFDLLRKCFAILRRETTRDIDVNLQIPERRNYISIFLFLGANPFWCSRSKKENGN